MYIYSTETCGDCEREFKWEKDDAFWDDELQMYICPTCVCVRKQSSRIEQLEKKIERLKKELDEHDEKAADAAKYWHED